MYGSVRVPRGTAGVQAPDHHPTTDIRPTNRPTSRPTSRQPAEHLPSSLDISYQTGRNVINPRSSNGPRRDSSREYTTGTVAITWDY